MFYSEKHTAQHHTLLLFATQKNCVDSLLLSPLDEIMGGFHRFGQQGEEPPHLPPGSGGAPEPGDTSQTLASADGRYRSPLHHGPGTKSIL